MMSILDMERKYHDLKEGYEWLISRRVQAAKLKNY